MFGDNLKKYRIQKNFSQNDLAEKLFVSRQCISKWEKGTTEPDLKSLENISKILDVSIDDLIKDGGMDKENNGAENARRLNVIFAVVNVLTALFCVTAIFSLWRFLPQTIPAHFTKGKIDRYGSRNEAFLNLISIAVFAAVDLFACLSLRKISDKRIIIVAHSVSSVILTAYIIFIIALYAKYITDVLAFVTCLCIGLLLCVSIAMHPKISRRNRIFGVRTSITLSSPEIWNRVNALACYLFSGLSIVLLILNYVLSLPMPYLFPLLYLLPAAVVLIYSKIIADKIIDVPDNGDSNA